MSSGGSRDWPGGSKQSTVIAQFRFDEETRVWALYCADRNTKWHEYYGLEPNKDLDALLKEVDADPTCIFWGWSSRQRFIRTITIPV